MLRDIPVDFWLTFFTKERYIMDEKQSIINLTKRVEVLEEQSKRFTQLEYALKLSLNRFLEKIDFIMRDEQ